MASNEGVQPLLADQSEFAAWDAVDLETQAETISDECTVHLMLQQHSQDALRFLQSGGIEKLAEFTAPDDLVFGAFHDEPILTTGSSKRHLNAEAMWRDELLARCRGKRKPTGNGAGWSTEVAVEAYVVTIRGAAGPGADGLIRPLLKQWRAKRCSFAAFSLPAVQSVIRFKWATYARRLLFMELALYCVWLISYYIFLATYQGEDLSLPLSEILQTAQGRVTVAAEVVALAAMAPFLALEAGSIGAWGWRWLQDPTNLLDLCTYALQIIISVTHLGRIWVAAHWLTYLLAVQSILLMFRLQYFTQCIRATRFSFPTMVRQVLTDMGWVLVFILLVCVAYGAAIHITFRQEKETPEEFSSFIRTVLAMCEHAFGDLELKDFWNTENRAFATALASSYIIIMGYVLINLVIGLVINSLDRVMEQEGAKQLANQARIIDELEAVLPAWVERRQFHWHPPYVHVLRIDPDKLDSVALDALWTKHGDHAPVMPKTEQRNGEDAGGENGAGGGGGDSCVMAEVEELKKLVARQGELIEALHRHLVEGGEGGGGRGRGGGGASSRGSEM